MRFPSEPIRELIRAKYWQAYYQFISLRRKPMANMRPFVVAGPPRSGTSLLCALLNSKPNVIISNEPKQITGKRFELADPTLLLRGFLHETAYVAVRKGKIFNKVDPHNPGQLTADTFNTGSARRYVPVHINPEQALVVGVKAPTPLFDNLNDFCARWSALRALVIIRDPVRAINSWRHSFGWQPGLDDAKAGPQFKLFRLVQKSSSALERRAHLWKVMAEIALERKVEYPDAIMLIRYEEVLADPQGVIAKAARHIGAPEPDAEIDVSFVKPQSRPNYKNLDAEEVAMITEICGPVWARLVEATGVNH